MEIDSRAKKNSDSPFVNAIADGEIDVVLKAVESSLINRAVPEFKNGEYLNPLLGSRGPAPTAAFLLTQYVGNDGKEPDVPTTDSYKRAIETEFAERNLPVPESIINRIFNYGEEIIGTDLK
ncbi:MAG: hypothetical protein QNJ49_16620 [Mastigocoleus sp. MO_167.B18]|nr:hypothetical protein [Mastigocoleus sp. MO_167.B18]